MGGFLLLIIPGIIAGFIGKWWGRGWIWTSLGLLVAISIASWALGTRYFNRLREAVGLPWFDGVREHTAVPPAAIEEVAQLISTSRTWILLVIGVGGIVVITWLMMFKPF